MASGIPSSLRQTNATSPALGSSRQNVESWASGTLGEELHGVRGFEVLYRSGFGRWQGQRPQPIDVFALDPEQLARGGQQAEPRALAVEHRGQPGRGVDDVLAVIDDNQEVLARKGVGQHLVKWSARLLPDPQSGGQRRSDLCLISDRGQIDKRGAYTILADQ